MADERTTGTARVKRGLAEMLRGGVIMDVVTPEQAKIAEDAGAVAVMALERVPADIRRDGGVARMSDPSMIEGIQKIVTIPVMAKCRIGHFAEAQVLQALGVVGDGQLADVAEDRAQVRDRLDDVAGARLALRPDHARALGDAAQGLTEVGGAADERHRERPLVDVVCLVGRRQHLGLVDVVDTERLESGPRRSARSEPWPSPGSTPRP